MQKHRYLRNPKEKIILQPWCLCPNYQDIPIVKAQIRWCHETVRYYHKENFKKPEGKRTNINLVTNMKKYIEDLSDSENFLKMTVCDPNRMIFNRYYKKIKRN